MCGKDFELYPLSSLIKCPKYTEVEILTEANEAKLVSLTSHFYLLYM